MNIPFYVLTDPELIKQVTIKDFDHFVNHDKDIPSEIDSFNGKILFSMNDEKWKSMRSVLSPIFTSSKMKMMFGILSESAKGFIDHFEAKSKGNNGSVFVDCTTACSRYTVDGISTAVLGFEGDCIKNEESSLFKFALSLTTPSAWQNMKIVLFLAFRWLYKKLKIQLTTQEVKDFFYNSIVKVMNEREKNGTFRPDVVQLLLQVKQGQLQQQNEEVNDKELSNFAANIEYDVGAKNKKMTNWTDEGSNFSLINFF